MATLIGKATVDRRGAMRTSDSVYFKASFEGRPTNEEISEAQIKAGYHPAGYGGPNGITITGGENNIFNASWFCYASCD